MASIILTRAPDVPQTSPTEIAVAARAVGQFGKRYGVNVPEPEDEANVIRLRGGFVLFRTPIPEVDLRARAAAAVDTRGRQDRTAIATERRIHPIAPLLTDLPAPEGPELPWNLQAIGITGAEDQPTGRRAKVAVLDSGIDGNHRDFHENPPVLFDVVAPGRGTSESLADSVPRDENGHGTHVSGIIRGPLRPTGVPRYGVAPHADLIAVNVIDDELTDWNLLKGIAEAAEAEADVITICLGVAPTERHPRHSQLFELVARILLDWYGTIIVAAAGNESNRRRPYVGPIVHPADCPSIVAVGAVDRKLEPALASSGGICNQRAPMLVAPGVDILSSFHTENGHAAHPYVVLNGTSAAAPHVAGVAALWVQEGYRGRALIRQMVATARKLGDGSPESERAFGAGLVQAPS